MAPFTYAKKQLITCTSSIQSLSLTSVHFSITIRSTETTTSEISKFLSHVEQPVVSEIGCKRPEMAFDSAMDRSDTRSATMASRLLQLPPELRNIIYRRAVVTSNKIRIKSDCIREPPLLLVCKQIRQEACDLYYYENEFTVKINDYDTTNAVRFNSKIHSARQRGEIEKNLWINMRASLSSPPHWRNLLTWLRLYHVGALESFLPKPSEPHSGKIGSLVIRGIFLFVRAMKTHPWQEVEAILLEQRVVLAKTDARWNDER